jgi:hypothetical protein
MFFLIKFPKACFLLVVTEIRPFIIFFIEKRMQDTKIVYRGREVALDPFFNSVKQNFSKNLDRIFAFYLFGINFNLEILDLRNLKKLLKTHFFNIGT